MRAPLELVPVMGRQGGNASLSLPLPPFAVAGPGWSRTRPAGWGRMRLWAVWARPLVSSWLGRLFSCSLAPCPQELLLAPALLEQLTCMPGSRELGRVLTVPRGQQTALEGYRDAVCRGQAVARAHRFSELAAELRNQLDAAKITQQVRPARQPACRSGTWVGGGGGVPGLLGITGSAWAWGCAWLSSGPLPRAFSPACLPVPGRRSLTPRLLPCSPPLPPAGVLPVAC